MATKIHHINPPEALDDLVGLVDLIRNWDEQGKPYVDQLNAAIDGFNLRIDAVGTLDQIEALKAQTDINLTQAVAKVAEAIQQAETIVAEARQQAADMLRSAADEKAAAEHLKAETDLDLRERKAVLDEFETGLKEREALVSQRTDKLARDESDLGRRQLEFQQQADRLTAALQGS